MAKTRDPRDKDEGAKDELEELTVADMNVEGMPWYRPELKTGDAQGKKNPHPTRLTPRETFHWAVGALGAGLLVVAAFGLAGFLFIEFCIHVWFR